MGWGLPRNLRWLPSPTRVPIDHILRTLAQVGPAALILDVGAGGRRIPPDVVTVDAFEVPSVDNVGDIHALRSLRAAYHADPHEYWQFTTEGLRLFCRDFEELDCGIHIGPTCGMFWVIRERGDSLIRNRYISNVLVAVAAVVTAPPKYLDYVAIKSRRSHRVASAVFFRGRMSGPAARR
jgi:hypothetical protein